LRVALALHEAQEDVIDVPVLPDARAVWQRAQWQARRDAQERAARPVVTMQVIATVVAVAAMLLAVVWLTVWTSIGDRIQVFAQGVRDGATSAGAAAVTVADVFTFEVPVGAIWLLGGAVAVGLSVAGLAVAFSVLADRSEA
jgi:hypothetical protein